MLRDYGYAPLGAPRQRGNVYSIAVIDPRGEEGRLVIDARNGRIVRFVPSYAVSYGAPFGDTRRVPRPPASVPHVASRTVPLPKAMPPRAVAEPKPAAAASQPRRRRRSSSPPPRRLPLRRQRRRPPSTPNRRCRSCRRRRCPRRRD